MLDVIREMEYKTIISYNHTTIRTTPFVLVDSMIYACEVPGCRRQNNVIGHLQRCPRPSGLVPHTYKYVL